MIPSLHMKERPSHHPALLPACPEPSEAAHPSSTGGLPPICIPPIPVPGSFLHFFFLIEVKLIYNVVSIPDVQQSNSIIYWTGLKVCLDFSVRCNGKPVGLPW